MTPEPWAHLVARANADARQPVLFITTPPWTVAAWDHWIAAFEAAGYAALAPAWPSGLGDPASLEAHGSAAAYLAKVVRALSSRPAIVGQRVGGRIALALAAEDLSAATVVVAPEPDSGAEAMAAGPGSEQRSPLLVLTEADAPFARAAAEDALVFVQRYV